MLIEIVVAARRTEGNDQHHPGADESRDEDDGALRSADLHGDEDERR
jgi:hypothetical protein